MYYIGLDIGSSSVKVALTDAATGKKIKSLHEPAAEMPINAPQENWAEQPPAMWWEHLCAATKRILKETQVAPEHISAIGISYQMHGLVVIDEEHNVLRDAIIWCDSRAIAIGNKAYQALGTTYCNEHLLNSPGNFTASKLKWVQENEPDIYKRIHKFMLPGDYIALKLSGKVTTTKGGLSQGILWDFKNDRIAQKLLDYLSIKNDLIPTLVDNYTSQGVVTQKAAQETGLAEGTPITYRAGDQPNNALSLNIMNPGEVAVTGGTSGVIYAVTKSLIHKETERVNNFVHVNHTKTSPSLGKLLCINGSGIQYRWLKNITGTRSYLAMNEAAATVAVGADGLVMLPFGNGGERMLYNKNLGTTCTAIHLNVHNKAHLYRAALEGIAFAFVYGLKIVQQDMDTIKVIRVGNDNLFQSEILAHTVTTLIGKPIEVYETTGAVGAARAAGIVDGGFEKFSAALEANNHIETYQPLAKKEAYQKAYNKWRDTLDKALLQ